MKPIPTILLCAIVIGVSECGCLLCSNNGNCSNSNPAKVPAKWMQWDTTSCQCHNGKCKRQYTSVTGIKSWASCQKTSIGQTKKQKNQMLKTTQKYNMASTKKPKNIKNLNHNHTRIGKCNHTRHGKCNQTGIDSFNETETDHHRNGSRRIRGKKGIHKRRRRKICHKIVNGTRIICRCRHKKTNGTVEDGDSANDTTITTTSYSSFDGGNGGQGGGGGGGGNGGYNGGGDSSGGSGGGGSYNGGGGNGGNNGGGGGNTGGDTTIGADENGNQTGGLNQTEPNDMGFGENNTDSGNSTDLLEDFNNSTLDLGNGDNSTMDGNEPRNDSNGFGDVIKSPEEIDVSRGDAKQLDSNPTGTGSEIGTDVIPDTTEPTDNNDSIGTADQLTPAVTDSDMDNNTNLGVVNTEKGFQTPNLEDLVTTNSTRLDKALDVGMSDDYVMAKVGNETVLNVTESSIFAKLFGG